MTEKLTTQEILRRTFVPEENALRGEGSSDEATYMQLSTQQILNRVYDEDANELRFI